MQDLNPGILTIIVNREILITVLKEISLTSKEKNTNTTDSQVAT